MTSYLRILRSFERKNEDLKNELAAAETELGYQLLKSNFEPAGTYRQSYVIMKDELNMLSEKCDEIDKLENQRAMLKKRLYDEKRKLPDLEEKIKKRSVSAAFIRRFIFLNRKRNLSVREKTVRLLKLMNRPVFSQN